MDKREFLEVLRESLMGEVSHEVIEQNIKYYDQYINSQATGDEQRILNELGDPRLIAKTVIESDKAAKQKGKFTGKQGNYSNYYTDENEAEKHEENTGHGRTIFFSKMTWYQKIMMVLVLVVVIIIIAFIGRIIFSFLFAFGVPIILILLVLAMFRKR